MSEKTQDEKKYYPKNIKEYKSRSLSKYPKPEDEVLLYIVKGVAGLSIYVGNDDFGHRIAGSKPWGGGTLVREWKINKQELLKVIEQTEPIKNEAR